MNQRDRIFLVFGLFFWAVYLFSLLGIVWFFALPVIGVGYVVFGGKRHD
ncbi:MAG: hypothetical protein MZU97_23680 [Bacillus subtilis]|nr:hypothetical protein [Bacillus subtilis]